MLFQPASRAAGGAGMSGDDDGGEAKELAVSIGAGALLGLNENTPELTYKLSIEVEY